MARLQLSFPEDQFYYSTPMSVRVTDINAGNHLGNDSMISMISMILRLDGLTTKTLSLAPPLPPQTVALSKSMRTLTGSI